MNCDFLNCLYATRFARLAALRALVEVSELAPSANKKAHTAMPKHTIAKKPLVKVSPDANTIPMKAAIVPVIFD